VSVGSNASLSVTASGTAPLSYQWFKSGTAVSGATSSTLSLSNVQNSDAGSYTVAVSNSITTTTSSAATLTVTTSAPPPPPSGGGGGGGALSVWFYTALAALAAARLRTRR
jgi:hypothetical protein